MKKIKIIFLVLILSSLFVSCEKDDVSNYSLYYPIYDTRYDTIKFITFGSRLINPEHTPNYPYPFATGDSVNYKLEVQYNITGFSHFNHYILHERLIDLYKLDTLDYVIYYRESAMRLEYDFNRYGRQIK